jgi:ankyrin repeat protein
LSPRSDLSPFANPCTELLCLLHVEDARDRIRRAAENTCAWLFEHPSYTNWLDQSSSILWIHGKPGSGKSTIMKYAMQETRHRMNGLQEELMASFFFNYKQEKSWNFQALFQSLLYQLWLQVPDLMFDRLDLLKRQHTIVERPGKDWYWNVPDLKEHLSILLTRASQNYKICILIDGLDECEEYQRSDLMSYLRRSLMRYRSRSLRICCSSRLTIYGATQTCKEDLHILLDDENQKDISDFIGARLEGKALTEISKAELTAQLLAKASGMFLWVKLALSHMRNSLGKGESIELTLHALPVDLDGIYRAILDRINEGGEASSQALKILQWTVYARRPLSIDELKDVLQTDASILPATLSDQRASNELLLLTDYEDMSWGLLERVPKLNEIDIVQFVHESARDFLLHHALEYLGPTLTPASNTMAYANYNIARICLNYLSQDEIISFARHRSRNLTQNFPLLQYAASNWLKHVQSADFENVSADIRMDYLQSLSEHSISRWKELNGILCSSSSRFKNDSLTFLHIASRYGLHNLMLAALNADPKLGALSDLGDGTGRTPLSWAAGSGNMAVASLLINHGASVNSRDSLYGLPVLSWAVLGGQESVVQHILNAGADINDDESGCPALCFAAVKGNQAVVRVLLENGANPNGIDGHSGQSALSLAAGRGHSLVVQHLLKHGANPSLPDLHSDMTPLQHAIQNSHVYTVETLLSYDAHKTDPNYQIPSTWVGRVLDAVLRTVKPEKRIEETACAGSQRTSAAPPNGCLSCSNNSMQSDNVSGKRSLDQGSVSVGGDGDGSGDRPKKRQSLDLTTASQEDKTKLRFACPFFKHAPQLYSQKENCSGRSPIGWVNVSRVK